MAARSNPQVDVAYTAVMAKGGGWTIGIAKRNEPGYYATNYQAVETYLQACRWADKANESMGLSKEEAGRIVASSLSK